MVFLALRALARVAVRLPDPLRRWITGPPPVGDRGAPLDGGAAMLVWLDNRIGKPRSTDPATVRRGTESEARIVETWPRAVEVTDEVVAGRPARRYQRPGAPLLLWLHGGGWVTGSLRSHDRLCRRLCAEGGFEVVALDYRLAPEHRFPAALDDTVAAVRALRPAAVGGDSAGGNLAAAAWQVVRDAGEAPPRAQVLVYPGLDQRIVQDSYRSFAEGFLLTTARARWYVAQYGAPDPLDPRASPGLHPDVSGLSAAVVLTCGFDPLRDEGETYATRLRDAGVPVVHLDAADQIHGFANMDGVLPSADRDVGRLVAALADLAGRLSG